jgi:hypothetical protein
VLGTWSAGDELTQEDLGRQPLLGKVRHLAALEPVEYPVQAKVVFFNPEPK